MVLLCTWIISSPFVTNFIARPHANPFWGSYRLIDRFDSVPGFDIRELFNFDRIILIVLFVIVYTNMGKLRKYKKIDVPFLTFVGVVSLSTLMSNNFVHAVRVALDTFGLCYIAYFIGKNMLVEDEQFNKYLNAVIVLGCILIVDSFLEFYFHRDDFMYRITGPFLYWENLGLTMAIIFFIVFFKKNSVTSGAKITTGFYNLLLILLSLVIFLTYTRTIMFVVLLGLLYLSVKGKEIIKQSTIKKCQIFIFFIVFMIVFSPILLKNTSFYQHRLTKGDESRIENYLIAVKIFQQNPIIGIGLKGYIDERLNFISRSEIEKMELFSLARSTCHNSYLVIASEMGMFGLIPMFLLVIFIYKYCQQYYNLAEKKNEKLWAITISSISIVYFLSAITFDPFFGFTIDNKLYYMCLGISVGRYGKLRGNL